MSKMIQLRNAPDSLHRRLKARAAMAGMSLLDYLLSEIREIVDRPTSAALRICSSSGEFILSKDASGRKLLLKCFDCEG